MSRTEFLVVSVFDTAYIQCILVNIYLTAAPRSKGFFQYVFIYLQANNLDEKFKRQMPFSGLRFCLKLPR